MELTIRAWRLRQAAREALRAGRIGTSVQLVGKAELLQQTETGSRLKLVTEWLQQSTGMIAK
jgi:hypothetical protein